MEAINQLEQKYHEERPPAPDPEPVAEHWRDYPTIVALDKAVKDSDGISICEQCGTPSIVYNPGLTDKDPERFKAALEVSGLYELAINDLQRCLDHGLIKLNPHPMPRDQRKPLPPPML